VGAVGRVAGTLRKEGTMSSRFQLSKSKDKRFKFVLKAGNSETILTSELYQTKTSAKNGIESVRTNCKFAKRYDLKDSRNGKFYFNLKAANQQIIGTSEMYDSERAREKGIDSVKANGKTHIIEEAA
jgi:uncharacterized protein YegP (UPF0339 family)